MWFSSNSAARTALVLCLAVAVVPAEIRGSGAVEKQLRDEYQGRTLLIRNFYAGKRSLELEGSGP